MNAGRLLRWRLRLAVGAGRGRGRAGRRVELLVGAAVAASVFLLAWAWTRALAGDPETAAWAPLALVAALHAAFVLSLLRDTAAALGHLFLSPDAPVLLASPLGPRVLVALKGGEALADAASFPATVALPVLFGYGIAVGAPAPYFAAAVATLLLLLCLTVGTGFLLALLLAPVVPAGQVRQWLRLAAAGFSLGAWLLLVWWNASPGSGRWAALGAEGGAALAQGAVAALPSGWAAQALVALARGGDALAPLAALGSTAVGVLAAVALAASIYPVAWQRAQVLNRRARRVRAPRGREAPVPGPIAFPRASGTVAGAIGGLALAPAFARRDARLVRRDPDLVWDMGLLLVMSSVLPIAVAPVLRERPQWIALSALLFFAAELGYDLGSRALPLERRAWPWVFAAPLSPRAILAARAASAWAVGAPLVALAGTAAWVGLRLDWSAAPTALGVAWALFTTTLAAGLAAGVYLGRADWRHPRQMLKLGGRVLLVAILMLLSVGLVLSLSAAAGSARLRLDVRSAIAWSSAAGLLVIALSTWAALRRLRRFEGLG